MSISKKNLWQRNLASRYIREVDLNEASQAGVGDVITSRSRDKLKTYLHYQSVYGHQTWQDGKLPWWASAQKVTLTFDHIGLRDHVTN